MSDTSDTVLRLEIVEPVSGRLDKVLASLAPEDQSLSRTQIARLIENGAVSKNGAVILALKTKALVGDVFDIAIPKAKPIDAQPEDIPLDIIYEDDDLIVVNKPAGMVVHPAPGSETGTLVNALLHHCSNGLAGIGGAVRPGIVHRIDKDTSGLLVVAKSDGAHQGLAAQFAAHSILRRYIAVTTGIPDRADPRIQGIKGVAFETAGVIRIATNIARHKTDRKRMAVAQHEGRHAITRMSLDARSSVISAAKVTCWLETGRTHQIRVHASYIGHGLLGDPIYGRRKIAGAGQLDAEKSDYITNFPRQALHAAELGFVHPITNKSHHFVSDLPEDMRKLCTYLALDD